MYLTFSDIPSSLQADRPHLYRVPYSQECFFSFGKPGSGLGTFRNVLGVLKNKNSSRFEILNFRFFDEISEIFGIYQHFWDLSTIMADHGAHTETICMGWDDDMRYLTLDCFFTYFEVCKTPVRSPETSKQQSYRLSKIPISRKKCIYPAKKKQKVPTFKF